MADVGSDMGYVCLWLLALGQLDPGRLIDCLLACHHQREGAPQLRRLANGHLFYLRTCSATLCHWYFTFSNNSSLKLDPRLFSIYGLCSITRQLLIAPLARCIIFLTSRTKDCSLAVQDTTQESRLGNKLCAIYVEVQIWPSWYKKRLSYYRTSLICFETVERSMRDVLSIDDKSRKLFPYCGRCAKTVVLGRDFRQVLPTAEYSCKA